MNVNAVKGLTWVATLAVGGYLGFFAFDFYQKRPELQKALSTERQKEVLDDVEPPKEDDRDLVAVARVKEVFGRDFDWTGKPPPPPPKPKERNDKPREKPKIPVSDLVKVLCIFAHGTDPLAEASYVSVSYTGVLSGLNEDWDLRTLRVGDTLPKPQDGVRVKEIRPREVVFAFADESRPDETLEALEYESRGVPGIVAVAEGHEPSHPAGQTRIQQGVKHFTWRPARTEQTGRNEWQIGYETAQDFNRDYGDILARDLKYRPHRDPRTGELDGVQVTDVAAGSLPSQHGVKKGDVVKSINGHRVTSVNGAINYVKSNADTTTRWVVVIESQGREVTRVYNSPPPE